MATVIGDFASDPTRFRHNMVFQPQQQPHHSQSLRSPGRPRDVPSVASYRHTQPAPPSSAGPSASTSSRHHDLHPHSSRSTPTTDQPRPVDAKLSHVAATPSHQDGASRFPTPPDSSSPSTSNSAAARPQNAAAFVPSSSMDASGQSNGVAPPSLSSFSSAAVASSSSATKTVPSSSSPSSSAASHPTGAHSIPSPASDSFPPWVVPDSPTPTPHQAEGQPQQTTIRVRDLAHIQSLARADLVTGNGPGILGDPPLSQMKYDISEMPIGDIIEMVAALLTKITTTNDLQHDALNRNAAHQRQAQQAQQQSESGAGEGSSSGGAGGSGVTSSGGSPYANSVLAFHGKNVPAITILSYLSRIHKYCPTTFEVFLSLLVYFDRMTERVNELVVKSEEERQSQAQRNQQGKRQQRRRDGEDVVMSSDDDDDDAGAAAGHANDSDETDEDLADSSDDGEGDSDVVAGGKNQAQETRSSRKGKDDPAAAAAASLASATATYLVVDSYNIHRLIIAGVTCASKFFSDVFYTNSRYAKVGGLPLAELNHLELQFLLLNDFRLAVPVEDLEAYATMLVEFYAREVVGQRSRPATGPAE